MQKLSFQDAAFFRMESTTRPYSGPDDGGGQCPRATVRSYLKQQNALPRSSLTTLLPVSIKSSESASGNTLSMTHTTEKFRPQFNVPVSNIMGPREALYLEDARMEAMYPLSLLSDILVTNFTAISYRNKLCVGIIACPDGLSDIDSLGKHLKRAHAELRSACLGK